MNLYFQLYSEEKRNYIQAPPNKTIKDVPDAHLQQFPFQSCYNNNHNHNLRQIPLSANHKQHQHINSNNNHHTTNEKSKGMSSSEKFSVFRIFKRDAAHAAATGQFVNNNNSNFNNPTSQSRSDGTTGTATDISKFHSNIVSMPRSNASNLLSTETSNDIDVSGSTNLNQHSKFSSTINNTSNNATRQLSRSPSTASTGTKKSFTSTTFSSSNSSSERELKDCL